MVVGQERLAVILLYSFALGVFFGIVYDVFRIRRIAFSHNSENTHLSKKYEIIECLVIFFEDILFAVICSVVSCVFIFYVNSGRFRSVAVVGALVGFVVYYKTVGRLVVFCSDHIIRFVKYIVKKIIFYTVRPIFKLFCFIIRSTLGRLFVTAYTELKKISSLKSAEKGFRITHIKGKIKNEKTFKYIRKSGSSGVHSVLHGHHNSDAV